MDGRSDFSASRRFRRLLNMSLFRVSIKKVVCFGCEGPRGDKVILHSCVKNPYVAKIRNLDGGCSVCQWLDQKRENINCIITSADLILFHLKKRTESCHYRTFSRSLSQAANNCPCRGHSRHVVLKLS